MINKVWLPKALLADVDYDLFWRLNPKKLEPFNEYYKLKEKEKMEKINFQTWLQGYYFQVAIVSAFDKNIKYLNEPINLFKENEDKSNDEIKNKVVRFEALAQMFNSNFRREKGG